MLFRILRWRMSKHISVDSFYEQEFNHQSDKPPSVYETERADCIRTSAEHTASAGLGPPNHGDGINVSHFGKTAQVDDPGPKFFAFIRKAHHLMNIADSDRRAFAEQIFQAIADAAVAGATSPVIRAEKSDVRAYVRERFAAQDPEWKAFLDQAAKDWTRFAAPEKKKPDPGKGQS